MGFFDRFRTKANTAQPAIHDQEDSANTSSKIIPANAYYYDSVVNRCANILTDCSAEVNFDIKGKYQFTPLVNLKPNLLNELLNVRPNPFMDISTFRRLVYLDYWFSARAFIYCDGTALYHLPENLMEVVAASSGGYIEKYVFNNEIEYSPNEIIFIKDNGYKSWGASQLTGVPRYKAAENDIIRKEKIDKFKENYLDNGTVLGLILETDQVLNRSFKERILESIRLNYNSKSGKFANTAFILDGGLKAKSTNQTSMSDLGLQEDKTEYNNSICTAFGVPPILLSGGNNANIRPNIELMFYLTILPNLKKVEAAFETFFGYDIKLDTRDVAALIPDQDKESARIVSLTNNGIITGNEGRTQLRLDELDDPQMNAIRIPQNIAGSSTGVAGQEGGAPTK